MAKLNQLNSGPLKSHTSTYKWNVHHLRPTWALGDNHPLNLWPGAPGHQSVGVHEWWDDKLRRSPTEAQEKILLAPTPTPKVNQINENNIGKLAEKCKKMTPPRQLFVEMLCPQARIWP